MTSHTANFEPLYELSLPCREFSSDWSHCDRIATYVARQISYARKDPAFYTNLLSSALNELLEIAFRVHLDEGMIACLISRAGGVDRIALSIPCDEAMKDFYRLSVDAATGTDAADRYDAALLSGPSPAPEIGLLELAIDYRAHLQIEMAEGQKLVLTADVALEDLD